MKLSYIKLFICKSFGFILYAISFLFYKDKKKWLYGCANDLYQDNSKYFFIYNQNNKIRNIWISGNKNVVKEIKNQGYEAYYRYSILGLYHSLTGKVYIFTSYSSDINFWTSGRSLQVNLWHGVGIKNIEFLINSGPISKVCNNNICNIWRFLAPQHYIKPDLFLTPSEMMKKHFCAAFRINNEQCIEAGYPRNRFCLSKDRKLDDYLKYNKVFLYMPTWRDNDISEKSALDLKRLNSLMIKENELLLIKYHPNCKILPINYFDNIKFLTKDDDPYVLFNNIDVLITDYSSVYYDFSLTGKPTIFYVYDIDNYEKNCRDLAFNFKDSISGCIVYNFEELCKVFESEEIKYNTKSTKKEIEKKFWEFESIDSCEIIFKHIIKVMELK